MAFAGCSGQNNSPADDIIVDEVPLDRRIGFIEPLSSENTTSGTHTLRLDDGDSILLKSTAINMDDAKYEDVGVEVRGIITYNKGSKPLMEVTNIDILEDYVIEETANVEWTEYEGTLFSIRYRDDFEMERSDGEITFTKEIIDEESLDEDEEPSEEDIMTDVFTIRYEEKGEDEDLLSYLNLEDDSSSALLGAGLTKSKVGTANLDALKEGSGDAVIFYVEGEDNFYTLSFTVSDHDDALKVENLFYEMVGSFALAGDAPEGTEEMDNSLMESRTLIIEDDGGSDDEPASYTVDLSGYETFESESIGFTMQYPKSWYFEGSNSSEAGVSSVYDFGTEPLDEADPVASMSIMSSDPSETTISADGTSLGKADNGDTVDIIYKGDGRYFRFRGPKSMEATLINMASSVSE